MCVFPVPGGPWSSDIPSLRRQIFSIDLACASLYFYYIYLKNRVIYVGCSTYLLNFSILLGFSKIGDKYYVNLTFYVAKNSLIQVEIFKKGYK